MRTFKKTFDFYATDKELDDAYKSDHQKDFNLRTLEIAFDRVCQFACTYCNPAFS